MNSSHGKNTLSPRPALPLRLEYILLGMIRRQATHGYEILRSWNDFNDIGLVWRIKPGSLYAGLEKLEQLQYVCGTIFPGDNSPQRKEYSITAAGEQAFLEWMQTPVETSRDFRQDFLPVPKWVWEPAEPATIHRHLSAYGAN